MKALRRSFNRVTYLLYDYFDSAKEYDSTISTCQNSPTPLFRPRETVSKALHLTIPLLPLQTTKLRVPSLCQIPTIPPTTLRRRPLRKLLLSNPTRIILRANLAKHRLTMQIRVLG